MKVCYYGDTNIGKVRAKNEDNLVLKRVWQDTHLLAVAIDGVGGQGGGDVAAELAARCISEHFDDCQATANSLDVLQAAVIYANNTICAQRYSQMRCVLTAALININTGLMVVCHIGDTRLYMLKDGVLTKVTSDHSLVAPLEESGTISEIEAMRHPQRNVITRSVGRETLHWGSEYIQTHTLALEPCTIMLCSDGLYDMVHSSQVMPILGDATDVQDRVERLIEAALDGGGRDNITVIVIDLKDDE